jgi:CheY-like chemotaxis protein
MPLRLSSNHLSCSSLPTHTPKLTPPTDGIECVKRFRAFERARGLEATAAGLPVRKRLPIIACSANDSDELKRDVIKAGMDGFMPKPCTRVKLALAIERIELDALEDKPAPAVSKSVCF